ncbi:hypothetical protein HDU92_004402 [Lobulomyces angularis]|nr:hypothetical protein HDU92_004402 [Lobulomyces angularis]
MSTITETNHTDKPTPATSILSLSVLGFNSSLPSLPYEVIDLIFEYGDINFKVIAKSDECTTGIYNAEKIFCSLEIPLINSTNYKIINAEVGCASHDQGWSGYPDDHNTYNNSWTWGEIAVEKTYTCTLPPEELEESLANEKFMLKDIKQYNGIREKKKKRAIFEKKLANNETRLRFFTNLHAVEEWQTHKFLLEEDKVVTLEPGDTIHIILRSMFPGWGIYAKDAYIIVRIRV